MKKKPSPKNQDFKDGQNVVEYLLLFVAVVIVLLFFLAPGGVMQNTLLHVFDVQFNYINAIAQNTTFTTP